MPTTAAPAGGAPAARPVFFLHVSSSGGSSVCRWAQMQPCARVPTCGANCNLNCAHPWNWNSFCRPPACALMPRPCRPPYRPGCAGLERYVRSRNITFFASETMLHPSAGSSALCGAFSYVTLIRHPVERIRSQLERMHPASPNTALRAMLSAPLLFNTSARTSLIGTPALDNYLVRLLLGPAAFFLPLRGINESHYAVASQLLASFAAVVPLDEFSNGGSAAIASALGWHGSPYAFNMHSRDSHRDGRAEGRRDGRGTGRGEERLARRHVEGLSGGGGSAAGGAGAQLVDKKGAVRSGPRLGSPRRLAAAAATTSAAAAAAAAAIPPTVEDAAALRSPVGGRSVVRAGPPRRAAASSPRRLTARPPVLGEKSLRLLGSLNRFDIRLYDEARARFGASRAQAAAAAKRGSTPTGAHARERDAVSTCSRRGVGLQCPFDRGAPQSVAYSD